jgi:(1->4)-alpha-D-glucan 1-alpha-D-glucosylmutase
VPSDQRPLLAPGVPISTYRLQLGPSLGFAAAAKLARYLADLGITHVYLSPILVAGPGSTHGYDVIDHSRINDELGGPKGFVALRRALRARGVGIVVDVVPNHMAIAVPEWLNPAVWSVLREGQASPFASWFDIDWDAEGGRVLMPVLDGPLEDNLERLALVERKGEPEVQHGDHRFPVAEGTAGLPMAELLEAQHYRLADWRSASSRLNYRRFCDITTLIGVRVEDRTVFDASHAVLVRLIAKGQLDGLRIDHPDGLADPADYLTDLATATHDTWVVVEKVLADGEPMPPDWQAAGTTGYETLTVINGLLVDPMGEAPLSHTYTELTGEPADFAVVAYQGKRLIALQVLAAELNRLTRLLAVLLDGRSPGLPFERLHDALVEVLCGLDVYRPFMSSVRTVRSLDRAIRLALARQPTLRAEIESVGAHALEPGEFGTRFGQTAAAIYAKGVEDTAFYRHARLLSLNEVGGDPGRFGVSLAQFHGFASTLQSDSPTAMTTLSTHDTKRGEDVRARLAVLSEVPAEWDRAVRRWLPPARTLGCPDDRTAYFFWQTLVGAWPLDVQRATRYMEKATREAKLSTSWQSPDADYDHAVRDFVGSVLSDGDLMADVASFVTMLEPAANANSVSQKLIQLTMPGVPDTYQGCELPNFRLVDPDNRDAVDFGVRRAALPLLLDEKLRATASALQLRRDHPDWFNDYLPMAATGPAANHLVAFGRSPSVIVLATRFSAHLSHDGGWRDTVLTLPVGAWVDALSGLEHDGGEVPVAELLRGGPVALLAPAVSVTP